MPRRYCSIRRTDIRSRWTSGRLESSCKLHCSLPRRETDGRYTLTIGKPPFQSKDVKAIYNRIRENRYDFPVDKPISSSAQDLIVSLLNPNPGELVQLDDMTSVLTCRTPAHARCHSQAPLVSGWRLSRQDTIYSNGRHAHFPFHLRQPESAELQQRMPPSEDRRRAPRACRRGCHSRPHGTWAQHHAAGARLPKCYPARQPRVRFATVCFATVSKFKADPSSAKQPLVQAPTIIRESALLRKLNAAGAHATLSPARRGKENVPGPSSRRMEAVGEEDEGEQEILGDEQRKTYDAGVRQRELANQKARIVSQMTGGERATAQRADHSSPRRSATTTPTGGLHPAKRVTAASDAAARPYQAATRVSLFDATRLNLDRGLEMGENFSSPRECSCGSLRHR